VRLLLTVLKAVAALGALAAAVFALTFAGLYLFSERIAPRIVAPEAAPLVIVLGSGVSAEGVLHPRPTYALHTALALYDGERVARLHFSGGALGPIPEAAVMRDMARERGVAAAAITTETRSTSTLQNVLYTLEEIGPPPPGTVIVADRAHLPRAWASFWWAGVRGHGVLPADPWPRERPEDRLRIIARETLALWYNSARMAEASARLALGGDRRAVADGLGRQPIAWGPPP
jgi:uncharacterized SAM-binding protein YcdF (DUF218 family)